MRRCRDEPKHDPSETQDNPRRTRPWRNAARRQAQIKCWIGADGKRACGDAPPAGAKVTTAKVPASPPPLAASKDSKNAKKGPMTPAEQEQAYRKRQAETEKSAAKAAAERQAEAAKTENCARARESVSAIQSG